jgi:hypothetical protein
MPVGYVRLVAPGSLIRQADHLRLGRAPLIGQILPGHLLPEAVNSQISSYPRGDAFLFFHKKVRHSPDDEKGFLCDVFRSLGVCVLPHHDRREKALGKLASRGPVLSVEEGRL